MAFLLCLYWINLSNYVFKITLIISIIKSNYAYSSKSNLAYAGLLK